MSQEDPHISSTYSKIGGILKQQGDLDSALEHFERALNIDLLAPQRNQSNIATNHNNIGSILQDQAKYADALKCFEHALKIVLEHLTPRHPLIATIYNNIGSVHNLMGDESTAFLFYNKTLDINEK
jgi:tetratricopeptide (TPR) repeat protein